MMQKIKWIMAWVALVAVLLSSFAFAEEAPAEIAVFSVEAGRQLYLKHQNT